MATLVGMPDGETPIPPASVELEVASDAEQDDKANGDVARSRSAKPLAQGEEFRLLTSPPGTGVFGILRQYMTNAPTPAEDEDVVQATRTINSCTL
ncbi:hypothetical protein [Sphingobium sp. SCG-1]|uniref:hypothetical protein n=1 Tax=Sphingobium sp. SCG-1 TaxID=2072936 RepID=UPI001CB96D89|nr:hypothetical protein [Sphingobium sp. SCG-1]